MAAGVWFFALRDQTPTQDEFVTAATRYVDAGQQLIAAFDAAHTYIQFDEALPAVRASSSVMATEVTRLQRIAKASTGRQAQVAQAAVTSAQDGVAAQASFVSAVNDKKITTADQAREKLTTALATVQQAIKDWERS